MSKGKSNLMEKEEPFQKMVLEKLDDTMQKEMNLNTTLTKINSK